MLAVEKEEVQGEADQQVIAVLEAAATTAAQLEATERSLAQARGRPNPNPTPLTLTLTLGLTLTRSALTLALALRA